jgi:regulatory Fis family protein
MHGVPERVLLRHLLEEAKGSRLAAARRIGVSRTTMYRWITAELLDQPIETIQARYTPRPPGPAKLVDLGTYAQRFAATTLISIGNRVSSKSPRDDCHSERVAWSGQNAELDSDGVVAVASLPDAYFANLESRKIAVRILKEDDLPCLRCLRGRGVKKGGTR